MTTTPKAQKSIHSYKITIDGIFGLLVGAMLGIMVLLLVVAVIILIGEKQLLSASTIASVAVVEVPLTTYFYRLERVRTRTSETIDKIDVALKYQYLKLHGWFLIPRFKLFRFFVVENSKRARALRLNGTLRERVKVQRGWKTIQTPLAEGQRVHYNFVKPHRALEGQTPAERAGIGVEGEDKWLNLLRSAIRREARAN